MFWKVWVDGRCVIETRSKRRANNEARDWRAHGFIALVRSIKTVVAR